MKQPRHHHYVPQCYLRGFVDPTILASDNREVLWVYEKSKEIRKSSPQNEAKQRDYYAFQEGGARNAAIEYWFAKLEAEVAPILAAVIQNARELTDSEKLVLSLFIGTMQTRTPAGRFLAESRIDPFAAKTMRRAANDPEGFRAFVQENDLAPQGDPSFPLEQLRQEILAGRCEELTTRDDFKLASIVEVGKMIGEILRNRAWQVLVSDAGQPFLTSDDPVLCFKIHGRDGRVHARIGVGDAAANLFFPLSKNVCLRVVDGERAGVAHIAGSAVRSLNKLMITCSDRFVYAPERSEKIKTLVDKSVGKVSVRKSNLHFHRVSY